MDSAEIVRLMTRYQDLYYESIGRRDAVRIEEEGIEVAFEQVGLLIEIDEIAQVALTLKDYTPPPSPPKRKRGRSVSISGDATGATIVTGNNSTVRGKL